MKNLKLTTFRAGTAFRALALFGAGAAASTAIVAPAQAQDYTSGALSGTVTDETGAPVSGATVTISNAATGFDRTVTTNSNGSFRINGLPSGGYSVDVSGPNGGSYRANGVAVQSGTTNQLTIPLSAAGEAIVVTGARIQQAFSGTNTGVNVNLDDLVKTTPIARNLSAVIQLAPGTSQGDSSFGDLTSIGGSSVAENAYYVNGLNTTNFDNYLGSARLPFDFYKSVEVKSGGYSAEYGRATGGIVNAVTKSGSNEFMAAAHLNWEPNFLDDAGKNISVCQNSDGSVVCADDFRDDLNSSSEYSATLETGLPIIKDRLFVYGLVEFRNEESVEHYGASHTAYFRKNSDPFWGAKVDAYPIDSQHLEFTIFDTRNTTTRTDKPFVIDENGDVTYNAGVRTDYNYGGVNFVGKWTGNMTDWLTLSAAYGRMRDRFDNVSDSYGTPVVYNGSGESLDGVPYRGYFNSSRVATAEDPYKTERKFYRADADLFFSALGDHHLRLGFDQENNRLEHVSVRTGSGTLCSSNFLTAEACNANLGNAGAYLAIRPGEGDNLNPYVEINYYNSGGTFDATNRAFYIEDEWNVTSRLTLNLGFRRDDFKVEKADGSTLVNLKDNYAPRIGMTYDLFEDHSGTIKAFYGQYYLPVASNTAYRQASAEYYFREAWNFDGFDGDGVPILTSQRDDVTNYNNACPFGLTPNSSGANCRVTGQGIVPDTGAAIAHNLKATKETEWLLGYEHQLGDLRVGLTYTHRNLDTNAEDMAIDQAVLAYCDENGISGCSDTWTGFHQYVITNPGQEVVVNLAGLDGQEVTFTPEQLGYPAAKRSYDAVDFTVKRPWDGHWSLNGSYTWSKSKGNSEGYVQSDFGQDDAGITQDFDQPGFTDYAYGYLPNDRRHRFKVWGAVAMDDSFTIGTNISVESPRSLSCIGFDPRPNPFDPDQEPYSAFGNAYGAASHYCNGEPSPRGTALESDWITRVDFSVRKNFEFATGQVLTLRGDVFNLFNSQGIQKRDEIGELAPGVPSPNYGVPTGFQTPRYVRLGADITF